MRLAQLQQEFQSYLLDDTAKHPFHDFVIDDDKVGANKRLSIYHQGYRIRIVDVLANVYPVLEKWLGYAKFKKVAHDFISIYPSTHRNMRMVGGELSQYLHTAMPSNLLAADIAAFEWALGLAFDAKDMPALTLQELGDIPPETWGDLRFALHPSVHIKQANTDAVAVWQTINGGKKMSKKIDKYTQPIQYLIWRQNYSSFFRKIDVAEAEALTAIAQGDTFGELCARLAKEMDEEQATQAAANYLAQWINIELLVLNPAN